MTDIDFSTLNLSPTVGKPMITNSALHGWMKHRQSGYPRDPPGEPFIRGKIIERLLIGEGTPDPDHDEEKLIVLNFDDYRGKDAKEARDAAFADGNVPVLQKKMDEYAEAVNAHKKQLTERGIIFSGETQKVIKWVSAEGVRCKVILDHHIVKDNSGIAWELKTTNDAGYDECVKNMFNLNYDMQCAAQKEGLDSTSPLGPGRNKVKVLWLEHKPPYQILPASLTGAMLNCGNQKWAHAKRVWARAIKLGKFEGYPLTEAAMDPLPWMIERAERLNWEGEMESLSEDK